MTEINTPTDTRSKDEIRKEIATLVEEFSAIAYASKKFVPGETAVPVSGKVIGAGELKNMVEAGLDGWLTTGRFNEAFEKNITSICTYLLCRGIFKE